VAAKKVSHSPAGYPGGFSLSELVIVLAVMAVLLTIAVPSYRHYAQRVERADAIRSLLAVAGCQERIRANTGFYDTTRCLDGLENAAYSFRVNPSGDTSSSRFEVIAEPSRSNGNDCGTLSLDHTGTRGISSEKKTLSACWGGR
jgi:type IV pilus assembly protein PilE